MAVSLIEKIKAAYYEGYGDGVCAGTIFEDVNKGWNESQAQAALTAIMGEGDGVQECDREAAQAIYNGESIFAQAGVKARDGHELVQAFARHRSTAAAAERARIVAWLRGQLVDEYGEMIAEQQQAWWFADAIERGEP